MIVTLPGQTFTSGSGNSGTVTAQAAGTPFNLTLTATLADGVTTDTTYSGTKTISYAGPGGSPSYTTSVNFTSGQATGVATTLTLAQTTTITATDGTLTGIASSSLLVNPGAINSYTVSAGTAQTVGVPFSTTVTAKDANNNTVTTDNSTVVTMTSASGNVQFDSNGDSTFGDNTKTLASGTFTISAKNDTTETTTITATDTSSKTGTTSSISFAPPATYTWNATSGSADWTVAASWTPSRTTPVASDILLFNQGGSSTATAVPAQTIGKLQVSGATTITLQAGAANNTLAISGGANALTVASGSALNLSGTSVLNINLTAGSTGTVGGAVSLAGAAHRLTAADAGAITFQSGAVCTGDTGFSGNAFGTTSLNSVIFASGATYVQKAGSNPFGASAPNSVVIFQTGSTVSVQGDLTPSLSGRTYANLEINAAAFNQSPIGSGLLTVDNLTVADGTLNLNLTGGIHIRGSLSVAGSETLTFSPASSSTITFTNAAERIISGAGTLTFGANANVTVANGAAVKLARNLAIPATLNIASGGNLKLEGQTLTVASVPTFSGALSVAVDRNGGSPLSGKLVLSSGTLAFSGSLVVSNAGAALLGGEVFDLFDAASFSGSFTATNLPPLGAGLSWRTDTLMTTGSIKVNQSPLTTNDAAGAVHGETMTVVAAKLLANDTDPDGDPLTITAASATSGSASVIGGDVQYTAPASGMSDTITYTVSDGFGGTANGTILVTLTSGNSQGFNQVKLETISGNTVRLTYLGIPGTNYALDWRTNLTLGDWTPVITNPAAANGFLVFTNTSGAAENYFRTRYVP